MPGNRETNHIVDLHEVGYRIGIHDVFTKLTLSVRRGSITAIMGPSGTGKTTLLRLITGQVQPLSGYVGVEGGEVATLSRKQLQLLRLQMGVLFQEGALFTDLTVFENIAFPVREHSNLPERLIRLLVLTKLQAVGLRGAADLMPAELSGGMARRVALARAIVMDPSLLLCDEPFTGLDPISTGVIVRLLRRMNEALGITIVIVSHDVAEIARLADMTYVISGGEVVASGAPEELKASTSAFVRQFLGGNPNGPIAFHYPAPDYWAQLLQGLE
jgi:phospholipid/cholesterol/gamma-HCH transport system ATP-binding protein